MSSTLRHSRLIDTATTSISYDRQVQSASLAFDKQMYQIIDETGSEAVTGTSDVWKGVIMIPNIMDLTDSNLVDILAWQFHVDFYDNTKPFEFRKMLVQKAITWHMRKGTYDLVQEVLDTYWPGGATLLEWFNYYDPLPVGHVPPNPPYSAINSPPITPAPPGTSWHDRYRFRVYIDEQIIDPADEAKVLMLIDRYKPISRWCEGIFRAEVSDGYIGWCGMLLRFIYRESEAPNYP